MPKLKQMARQSLKLTILRDQQRQIHGSQEWNWKESGMDMKCLSLTHGRKAHDESHSTRLAHSGYAAAPQARDTMLHWNGSLLIPSYPMTLLQRPVKSQCILRDRPPKFHPCTILQTITLVKLFACTSTPRYGCGRPTGGRPKAYRSC